MAKQTATLKGLVIYCPKCEKDVTIVSPDFCMSGWEQNDEENYYSDSGVTIDIVCECRKKYQIQM